MWAQSGKLGLENSWLEMRAEVLEFGDWGLVCLGIPIVLEFQSYSHRLCV